MRWKQFFTPVKSVSPSQAQKIMNDNSPDNFNLIDVRQPNEYETSHIPGSKLIPMSELDNKLDDLDPTKPTLVY